MAANQPKINLKLVGDKQLQRALVNLEPKTGRKVINKAVRESAKIIQRQAKANAPRLQSDTKVGPGSQMPTPGTLRKGIKVRKGKRRRFHYRTNVVMDSREKMGIPGRGEPGGSHYAPAVLETGSIWIEGEEYMRGAYETKGRLADSRMIRAIRTGILRQFTRDAPRGPRSS